MTQKDVFKSSAYHKWGLTSHHAVMFIISYCHNSNKSPRHVEFVNYSWRASENCILLAPLGKYAVFISGLLLRMYASFVVAFKLVLENMLSHASTMFHSVLKETLKNIQFFRAGESWSGASESWISLALLGKLPQKLMSCPGLYHRLSKHGIIWTPKSFKNCPSRHLNIFFKDFF